MKGIKQSAGKAAGTTLGGKKLDGAHPGQKKGGKGQKGAGTLNKLYKKCK